MKLRISLLALLATILGLRAVAQDEASFLKPVDGYLSSYGHNHFYLNAVRDILVRGDAQSPAIMVTLPSFQPESMVFILQKDGQSFVVSAKTTKQIWGTDNKEQITIEKQERPIKTDIANQISAVFALATSQTRYPKAEQIGLDGIKYHFSSFVVGIGVRAGQTWSPDSQSTCGMLVTLGGHMHEYVCSEFPAEKLELETQALLQILKKSG